MTDLKPKLVKCVEGKSGYDLISPRSDCMLEIRGGLFTPTLLMFDVHVNVLTNEEGGATDRYA